MHKSHNKAKASMTVDEASTIIKRLNAFGINIEHLAIKLGVSRLYVSRLEKPAYWKDGLIPAKTGRALRELIKRHSPSSNTEAIVENMCRLQSGDIYCIHSAGELLEFHNRDVRRGILEVASRGVKVQYMFPNVSKILPAFSLAPLDLALVVPFDLRSRYECFMKTLLFEAQASKICSQESLSAYVEVSQVESPFLFSPWQKTVFYRFKGENGDRVRLFHEHFSLEETVPGGRPSAHWACDNARAEAVVNILLASKRQNLSWDQAAKELSETES